ncbi:MAG: hypothetical protein IPH07_02975 [Deltaproteobacteria bacterium]|nr:hypothetical protein [Deltaproteobacteria bacterium]MBP7291232.1 hypothetical protein [Nannocystaceae bacterium]
MGGVEVAIPTNRDAFHYLLDYWEPTIDQIEAGPRPPDYDECVRHLQPSIVEAWRSPRSLFSRRLRRTLHVRSRPSAWTPDDLLLVDSLPALAQLHRKYFDSPGDSREQGPATASPVLDPGEVQTVLDWLGARPLRIGQALVSISGDGDYIFSITRSVDIGELTGSAGSASGSPRSGSDGGSP